MSHLPPGPPPRRSRWGFLTLQVALLLAIVLLLHHKCLQHGLFMDDHPHFRQLQAADWSLGGLTHACRLELFGPGAYCEAWWMPPVTLRFFRPVAFALMKLTYTLSGWRPEVMHAASLLWHLLACLLLSALLQRLGVSRAIALGAAALFAMHPAHVATVQWIAAQTELMVTVFLLGAALCWARWRGWAAPANGDGDAAAAAGFRWRRRAALGGAAILFAAALGCRENAIMLPVVLLAGEQLQRRAAAVRAAGLSATAGRRGRAAFVLGYGLLAVIAIGYLLLRSATLGGLALPPRPYVFPPGEPGFLRFVLDKAGYYVLGEFLLAPIVPFGGILYLREHALAFYALLVVVLLLIAGVVWWSQRAAGRTAAHAVRTAALAADRHGAADGGGAMQRLGRLAPLWLLGFMLPVLPSFESPHHLYLPGCGWAMILSLAAQLWLMRPLRPGGDAGRAALLRPRVLLGAAAAIALLLAPVNYYYSLTLDVAQQVEDNIVAELAAAQPPLRDGETLYITNLPLVAHYVQLPLEAQLGRHLRVVALSWAPRLLGLASGAELDIVDASTIEMRIFEDRWFAGPLGYLAREAGGVAELGRPGTPQFLPELRALRLDPPAAAGPSPAAAESPAAAAAGASSADGLEGLRIEFSQPLQRPGRRLFWGSRLRWAHEVALPGRAE